MKAAIYCRLSEEDRNKANFTDDSRSIKNQKSMLLDYAQKNNFEIYGIYSDDDYSGTDRNRPEFNRLIRDASEKLFDIVLCKSQSRFSREIEIVEKYINGKFAEWGIRFIGVADNTDSADKANIKCRQINSLINEWYLQDMSENIRSVLTHRRKQGMFIGAFAPYGYKKDPINHGKLIVDYDAAAVVKEIFTCFAAGYSKNDIARMLNGKKIPNPTEYKKINGFKFNKSDAPHSKQWKYYTVNNILHNEVYIGNLVQGKYGSVSYKTKKSKPKPEKEWIRAEKTHEPVIGEELWNNVQSILKQHQKPFKPWESGVFTGKVRCKYCGRVMRSCKSHGKKYLKCATKYEYKGECKGAFISVEVLENAVLLELNNLIFLYRYHFLSH